MAFLLTSGSVDLLAGFEVDLAAIDVLRHVRLNVVRQGQLVGARFLKNPFVRVSTKDQWRTDRCRHLELQLDHLAKGRLIDKRRLSNRRCASLVNQEVSGSIWCLN